MDLNAPQAPPAPIEYCVNVVTQWDFTCLPRGEWASWMQAIGALVALAIAILVPALQHRAIQRQARADRVADDVRLLAICLSIAKAAESVAIQADIHARFRRPTPKLLWQGWRTSIARSLDSLRSIPLHLLCGAEAVSCVISLRRMTEVCASRLSKAAPEGELIVSAGKTWAERQWSDTRFHFKLEVAHLQRIHDTLLGIPLSAQPAPAYPPAYTPPKPEQSPHP